MSFWWGFGQANALPVGRMRELSPENHHALKIHQMELRGVVRSLRIADSAERLWKGIGRGLGMPGGGLGNLAIPRPEFSQIPISRGMRKAMRPRTVG
jgi:hypothetical protein